MDAFVKSFATYRTVKKAAVISSALVLDSLEADTSTVTVKGTAINRSDTGNWLIIAGEIYFIRAVQPQADRTMLTLVSPLDAFTRPLELDAQPDGQTIGGFILNLLTAGWIQCSDMVYAMPYLVVSNSDTTAFLPPEVDSDGCFELASYCRLMRKSYGLQVSFRDSGTTLNCAISKRTAASRKVSFEDGRSQLQSVNYSSSGVAKITVLQDVSAADGNAQRTRTEWYLSESGEISQTVPARRAPGSWTKISAKENDDIEAKVVAAFAKNKANHKLEFWSTLDLEVLDNCTFLVYGELLQSYISYKRKSSEDMRFYYKSGELATTATEKLRGVYK